MKGLSFQTVVITVALAIIVLVVIAILTFGKEFVDDIINEILKMLFGKTT